MIKLAATLLLYWLSSAAFAVTQQQYEHYLFLQKQLAEHPAETLPDIESFHQRLRRYDEQAKIMAASLHLDACMQLTKPGCALVQAKELLSFQSLNQKQRLELLRLSGHIAFEVKDFAYSTEQTRAWLALATSINQALLKDNAPVTEPEHGATSNQTLITAAAFAKTLSLQAYGYYQLQRYTEAIDSAQQAIAHEQNESRYLLLLSLYQQVEDLPAENKTLQTITSLYPEQTRYWERLASTWQLLGQPEQALSTLGSAYKSGLLSSQGRIRYAQLLLQQGAPARAAHILESHQDQLESSKFWRPLLLQAYLTSFQRQKALNLISTLPNKQRSELKLKGQLAYSLGQWQEAARLLGQQAEKEPGNPYWRLLQGISLYEQKRYSMASSVFESLRNSQYKSTAGQWLQQISYLQNRS